MTQPAESLAPVTPDASAPSAARRRLLYAGVAGAAALGGAGFAWWKFQPHAVEPGAEQALWGLEFETPAGSTVAMKSLAGKPLVLNFWATWCPPCRAEMPALQAVAQAYREQGVRVLGVNQAEEPNQVVGFMQTLGLDFPVLLDRDAAVSQLYRVRSLPTTFFIDREGVIREIVIGGPMSQALLASKMESLLK